MINKCCLFNFENTKLKMVHSVKVPKQLSVVNFCIEIVITKIHQYLVNINYITKQEKNIRYVSELLFVSLFQNEKFALYFNIFIFCSVKYMKQIKGVPIRSLISNLVAEWKMRKLEWDVIHGHKNEIRLWVRYVDDTFIITKM